MALLGENFRIVPKHFLEARKRYGNRIVRYGYVEKKEDYQEWLRSGDLVVSTSIQENFGISVVEAVRFGCLPLLPRRLSYPELIPGEFHRACLCNAGSRRTLSRKAVSWYRSRPPSCRLTLTPGPVPCYR